MGLVCYGNRYEKEIIIPLHMFLKEIVYIS